MPSNLERHGRYGQRRDRFKRASNRDTAPHHSAESRLQSPATNETDRYVHFTAPDGQLYELIERR